MAAASSANAVLVDLSNPTGQIVHGTEFGLSTSMGDANHDYLPYGDSSFDNVANQYPVDLLRHNWELNTMMDQIFPNAGSVSNPNWTQLDNYLNAQPAFKGFFNASMGRLVVTLGFPSWLDISNSSDQQLYAQMVSAVAQHFAQAGDTGIYWDLVNEPDGHYSPTDMGNIFNAAATAIKAVDPTAKTGGIAESWYQSADYNTFEKIAAPNIDFISWHQYVSNGSDGATAQQEVNNALTSAQTTAQQVYQQAVANGVNPNVQRFLGEYNVDGGNYSDPNNGNMVGAVAAAAATYGLIASNSNADMAALWETLNDGSYNVFGAQGNYAVDPVGVTLSTLSDYMPGNLVQTTMPGNTPGLVGYTTTYGGGFSMALIDTNLSQGYTVDLSQGNLPTTGLTSIEISSRYPTGNKTTRTDLSSVNVPAGSIVIITNEASHGGVVYNGGAATPPPTGAGSGAPTPPPSTSATPSPDNTVITASGGGSITDASGNAWSIVGGQVAVNGTPDTSTANVIELAYEKGLVWQENSSDLWWSKSSPSDTWSPGPGTSTSPVPASAVAPDQLVLTLSEDAYQGDAQFIAKMDGTQLGAAQSVTASNTAGQTQDFTFSGTWGAGPHNVEVDFINDAYAGPGQDRNLYVDQVTYDGKAALTATDPLYANGGVTIAVHS